MAKKENKIWLKIKQAIRFVEHDVWHIPLSELSPRKTFLIRQLRILIVTFKGFAEDKVQLRASALTYYSLFAIVPVVGMAFGIAKGFGLESFLDAQLRSAFSSQEEVLSWILNFSQSLLETASGGMVAGVGMAILLYTVWRILNNIEESFNDIWQVKKARPWSRKFSDYFSMMFLAPFFLILASASTVFLRTQIISITESISLLGYFSPLLMFLVNLIPYLLVWIMLLIVYLVMPNTNVRFSSALIAAIIAGTLFQLMQWWYIYFQVGVSRYNAIYGSFAALPLLMFFMQLSWVVILFGAELAYANQNIENYEFEAESQRISPFNRKLLSLYIMHLLVSHFEKGNKPPTPGEIAHSLQIPGKLVRGILNTLTEAGLVNEALTDRPKEQGFQPALDINKIDTHMVLERLDRIGADILIAKDSSVFDRIRENLAGFERLIADAPENLLLKDIQDA